MKLVLPAEQLQGPVALPDLLLRFIGVCEVLGAVGLILPRLTSIMPILTPLASLGLTIILVGAVVITLMSDSLAMALVPGVVGLLCLFVAYGRWRLMP